jgi:hypothetical protein
MRLESQLAGVPVVVKTVSYLTAIGQHTAAIKKTIQLLGIP